MQSENKTALITGGTGALGSVVVQKFLEENFNVAATYRNEKELEKFSDGMRNKILFVKTDLTDEESVRLLFQGAIKRFATLDILINIAGGFAGGKPLKETSLDELEKMFSLNTKTTFLCTREFLRSKLENEFGRIINIAAMTQLKPSANKSAYTISKSGVVALTQSLAEELKGSNVTVNAIAPSIIHLEENKQWGRDEDLQKWVTPEEIAITMIFLASENACSINGAVIPMFGGM